MSDLKVKERQQVLEGEKAMSLDEGTSIFFGGIKFFAAGILFFVIAFLFRDTVTDISLIQIGYVAGSICLIIGTSFVSYVIYKDKKGW